MTHTSFLVYMNPRDENQCGGVEWNKIRVVDIFAVREKIFTCGI